MTKNETMSETQPDQEIRGLIFDCDGTLADTMPLHFIAWRSTLNRHGMDMDEDRFYSMAGQPTVQIVELLMTEHGLAGDAKKVAAEKEQGFLDVLPQVEPISEVVDIARQHKGTLPMAVASGSRRNVVFDVLKHIGLTDFFDAVLGAEDTKKHKPEPDVFLEAAARIKIQPSYCRVYEDADLGVEAAARAGMTCFDVRSIHTPRRVTSS